MDIAGRQGLLPVLCGQRQGVLTGDSEGTLVLWDLETKTPRLTVKAVHRGPLKAVACCPDGRTFASGGEDGTVKLWETVTGGELLSFAGKSDAVSALAFAADGTLGRRRERRGPSVVRSALM